MLAWLLCIPGDFNLGITSVQAASRPTLTVCLKELAARQRVSISFSPSITDKIYPRRHVVRDSVAEELNLLLEAEDLDYKVVDGVYVIYPRKRERVKVGKPQAQRPEKAPPPPVKRDTLSPVLAQATLPRISQKIKPLFLRPYISAVEVSPASLRSPRLMVKTNMLYDFTTSVSLGLEFAVAPEWTIEIAGSFNAWTFSDDRKWKHLLLQPEVRYWFGERFSGHFVGAHLHGGMFNIGRLPALGGLVSENMQQRRYQGFFYGAGVSYGYQWVLNRRWRLEPSVGLGYARIVYDKFSCGTCGLKIKSGAKNYFGPTKMSISLIYSIK